MSLKTNMASTPKTIPHLTLDFTILDWAFMANKTSVLDSTISEFYVLPLYYFAMNPSHTKTVKFQTLPYIATLTDDPWESQAPAVNLDVYLRAST